MTTTLKAETLRALAKHIGPLPISQDWMYSAIRHCQRNMDFDCDDGGNEPDRQSGTDIARLVNMLPEILALLEADKDERVAQLEAENGRMREALTLDANRFDLVAGMIDDNKCAFEVTKWAREVRALGKDQAS